MSKATRFIFFYCFLLVCTILLTACAHDQPPTGCDDTDFLCFENHAMKVMNVVRTDISYWSNINLIAQVSIVIAGIIATIMIALQGDENKHWTRPVGLIATALVTGISSALGSFHVPENVDKLVDIVAKMDKRMNEFDYQLVKNFGADKEKIKIEYLKNENFRNSVNDVTFAFANDFSALKIELLRLNGTAARLTSVNASSPVNVIPPIKDK